MNVVCVTHLYIVECYEILNSRFALEHRYEKIVKPDYSVLLQPKFWFSKDLFKFDGTVNEVKKERGKEDL